MKTEVLFSQLCPNDIICLDRQTITVNFRTGFSLKYFVYYKQKVTGISFSDTVSVFVLLVLLTFRSSKTFAIKIHVLSCIILHLICAGSRLPWQSQTFWIAMACLWAEKACEGKHTPVAQQKTSSHIKLIWEEYHAQACEGSHASTIPCWLPPTAPIMWELSYLRETSSRMIKSLHNTFFKIPLPFFKTVSKLVQSFLTDQER